jgi:chemotaxis signal transduction protein
MTEVDIPFAPARVLSYAPGRSVAFAEHCAVALIETPAVYEVPGASLHCLGLIEWTGRLIPLIDLRKLADHPEGGDQQMPGHVLVLAWQPAAGKALNYGAICAPSLVTAARVSDAQSCDPPEDAPLVTSIAAAFFEHDGHAVPILDTRRLFAADAPEGS